jgi:hypothetical protein
MIPPMPSNTFGDDRDAHTFYGPHPEILGDGTPLANGSVVAPNFDDPHDQHLIARGWLMPGAAPIESASSPKAPKRLLKQED